MTNQACLEMHYKVAKTFGKKVKYSSIGEFGFSDGTGEVLFSKRSLWSEWYSSCCATILFQDKWASLSHRNLMHESGYNTKKDIEFSLDELAKVANSGEISGFVVGGNPKHMGEMMESLNKFNIIPINEGSYFSEMWRGLVVVPETRRIILCETREPDNKAFEKNYKILN